ncbi:MAG: chromate transporter [Beijerinckiaceae bacterium]
MSDENPLLQLAWIFGTVALISMGGANTLVPEFHRQVVTIRGWMSGAEFAHLLALAQIAPGPNMLVVSLIGFKVAGFPGLVTSTLSLVAPTGIFAWFVGKGLKRLSHSWWLGPVKAGLAPLVVGLMLASGMVIAKAANHHWTAYILTAGTAVFIYATRRNPLWAIGAGALAGVIAYRLGYYQPV